MSRTEWVEFLSTFISQQEMEGYLDANDLVCDDAVEQRKEHLQKVSIQPFYNNKSVSHVVEIKL